ncbi:glycosyltransferase [Hyphobacterium sp.]|uniref:glycosyltransferase n=1 Tax=Hyphobacterium sp. TaxID=2004662 RepID=UPI003BA9CF92
MPNALLLAQRFDKRDGRQLRVRAALREAGYSVTSLAFNSGGEDRRDPETRDLRPRATGLLMLGSQLVVAGVIAGYFLTFYPLAMTITFWTLVVGAIYFVSPWGLTVRNVVLARLSERIGDFLSAKTRFDVIWAADPESLRLATRIAKRDGARLIYDAHEFHREEAPEDEARRQWVIREEEAAAPLLTHLVTINPSIGDLYKSALPGIDPVIIRNVVDARAGDRDVSPLRVAAGASPDTKILLYHGALRSLRNLRELTQSAALLPEPWKLVILGDGPLKAELAELGGPAILMDMVPYEDMPLWLAGADLGAVLYEDVGLNQHHCSPNKLYEYIAYGVPFLASDLPELRYFAQDAGCGRVMTDEISPETIARMVSSLSDEDMARMRENCAKTASTLSWSEEKQRLFGLLNAS